MHAEYGWRSGYGIITCAHDATDECQNAAMWANDLPDYVDGPEAIYLVVWIQVISIVSIAASIGWRR